MLTFEELGEGYNGNLCTIFATIFICLKLFQSRRYFKKINKTPKFALPWGSNGGAQKQESLEGWDTFSVTCLSTRHSVCLEHSECPVSIYWLHFSGSWERQEGLSLVSGMCEEGCALSEQDRALTRCQTLSIQKWEGSTEPAGKQVWNIVSVW